MRAATFLGLITLVLGFTSTVGAQDYWHNSSCFCGNCLFQNGSSLGGGSEFDLPNTEIGPGGSSNPGGGIGRFRNFNTPRWTATATDGSGLQRGDPTTITWSIIPDGTSMPNRLGEGSGTSTLINWLDDLYHDGSSPGGSNLTQRTWWQLMDSVFDRWSSISGLSYVYEPNDDGATHTSINNRGELGVRGDVRIGAKSFTSSGFGNVLGYNFGPNNGDMVLHAGHSFYNNTNNNSLRFRNVFAHEHGHGLGMAHVEPVDQTKLMEPFATTAFDGPQFDEILNAHRHYGDYYEKSNGGLGNDTADTATHLGSLQPSQSLEIGTDAVGLTSSLLHSPTDTDFISIDGDDDIDFLSFTLEKAALIDLILTPVGPTYLESAQNGDPEPFDTSALNDLALALFDTDGETMLAFSDSGGLGDPELILDQALAAGTYFARVTGSIDNVQMYHLLITASAIPEPGFGLVSLLACIGWMAVTRRRVRGGPK